MPDGLASTRQHRRDKLMPQKPMTKTQLVAALAESAAMDKVSANRALDALTEIVTKEVSNGGAVTLPGLGKFACRDRPERMVRNPATGEQMKKPADRVAKVTIAKQLKDVINA
jgi:DNA-binding protein HU-beta